MKIVFLGTAGYHPNEHRQTTSVMIPEAGIVFDAGTSLFRLPAYLQTDSIDIFLTHAHLDHVVGLTFLLDILYQHPLSQVRVHGDFAKLKAIREHLFSEALFPVEPPYVERPLVEPVAVAGGYVSWKKLTHPGGSLGFRIDWPTKAIAFITDTTADPDGDYVDFVRGVDLLVHECNFSDGLEDLAEKTGHSCLTPVVELARKAEVGGLVLHHFNPLINTLEEADMERARTIFAPIVLAEDGMEIEI